MFVISEFIPCWNKDASICNELCLHDIFFVQKVYLLECGIQVGPVDCQHFTIFSRCELADVSVSFPRERTCEKK